MKPGVTSLRYLVALAPLALGVLLGGCGGLLGAVNGVPPQPLRFTVTGTAFVEAALAGGTANAVLQSGSTVRLVRRIGASAGDIVVVGAGTVGANGEFTLTGEISAAEAVEARDDLFEIEVLGQTSAGRVFLIGTFVLRDATAVTRDVSVASTIGALNLAGSATLGNAGTATQTGISSLISRVRTALIAASTTLQQNVLAAVITQATNTTAARLEVIADLEVPGIQVLQAAITDIQILVDGAPATTTTITVGRFRDLAAVVAGTTDVPVGVNWSILSGNTLIALTQNGANSARAVGVGAGTATVRATLVGAAAPIETLTINVTHQQGHGQGGSTS